MGSMKAPDLQALTAYMSTLGQSDDDLRRVGLYRYLGESGRLADEVGAGVGEGAVVQAGWDAYASLRTHLDRGRATFVARCGSCHEDGVGAHTTERMVRLDEVGRFFAPTVYQRELQAIRATFLRDLYWTQHRGLLSDGHVRNLTDLVDPDRCTEGSALYDSYYTLHVPSDPGSAGRDFPATYPATGRRGDVFRVTKSVSTAADDTGAKRNRFIERHKYFVTVPWDSSAYYWDYQKMRREYGPAELGTAGPIGMPAAPHPWCAGSEAEVEDLVQYLLTL
jgi:cytochrome c553